MTNDSCLMMSILSNHVYEKKMISCVNNTEYFEEYAKKTNTFRANMSTIIFQKKKHSSYEKKSKEVIKLAKCKDIFFFQFLEQVRCKQ
jgi:hypothetical protein